MNNLPQNILCETSTVADGNMDFRYGEQGEVMGNRSDFLQKFGLEYDDHIAMRCDHGDIITLVNAFHPAVGARTQEDQVHSEVLVTQAKGLALMLFTADCQPVTFYDPVTETIALAHISRKTLSLGLSKLTIKFLVDTFGIDAQDLIVHIGPSIKKESYAFPVPLDETSKELQPFTTVHDDFAHIDLIGAHLQQLLEKDVSLNKISISSVDTGASADHFSYYKMKKNGESSEARMANILMLR